jgi:hypothetical protein
MSYSYIKTVFPTFENTISFNTNTFNDLNSQVKVEQKPLNVSGLEPSSDSTSVLKKGEEKFFLTQQTLLDEFTNTNKQKVVKTQLHQQQPIQDNLHYYNTPLHITEAMTNEQPQQQIPQPQPQPQIPVTNTVQADVKIIPTGISKDPVALRDNSVCSQSYNHVMDCAQCKEMLYRNFNFENKKNDYKEEIFELISYCIFAIFILFLLEKLHK